MSLKKIVGTLCLGIGLVLGGNASAHATFSYEAVQLQYSIGADLEIFGIDTAVYHLNNDRPELNFGNSHAQFRNNRNSVFVWYSNPKTDLNEILTKITDLNGDGIVDIVKINDLKP
ncbi:MAG: hypothetical protein KKA79_05410 [Nanoarchaeota archaeon]|nr:hypothetical protein [Nanoarchaeota archaeon]